MTIFLEWTKAKIHAFAESEAGAVTVDWVVLTAALVGMIMGVFQILTTAVYEDAASAINDGIVEAATDYR